MVLWLVLDRAGLVAHAGDEPARPGGGRRPARTPSERFAAHRSWARRGIVVMQTAAIGLLVSLVWEGARWLEAATRPTLDAAAAGSTVAHVLAGMLGALVAGYGLAEFVRRTCTRGADADRPRVSQRVPLAG